jgi:hypothetical protein
VLFSFYAAQIIVGIFLAILALSGVSLKSYNPTTVNFLLSAIVYITTISTAIGLPWLIKNRRTSLADIGFKRLPTWTDILLTPAALIVYLIFSSILIMVAMNTLPWFDVNQIQDTGFSQLNDNLEYILAFFALVVMAPIAEEVLFRGYLYGKLRKFAPIWAAIIVTSLLFGFVHGAWNLAVDTFALSVVLCLLREQTGSLWASILLHMAKNGMAFYFLFINPSLFAIIIR